MAEKMTNSYETIFIIDASLEEDQIAAVKEKFTSLIAANGTVSNVDDWGKRRLAYEINDKTEGYYVLVDFEADGEFPKELERVYGITEGVLREIVVKKEA